MLTSIQTFVLIFVFKLLIKHLSFIYQVTYIKNINYISNFQVSLRNIIILILFKTQMSTAVP